MFTDFNLDIQYTVYALNKVSNIGVSSRYLRSKLKIKLSYKFNKRFGSS